VRDNVFDNLNRCVVHRPLDEPRPTTGEPVPQIVDNQFHSADALRPDEAVLGRHLAGRELYIIGESLWEGNTIYMNTIGIGCDCEFTGNFVGAASVELSLNGGFGAHGVHDVVGPSGEERRNCPVFRENTFEQAYRRGDLPWWYPRSPYCDGALQSFLFITGNACPVFESNDFVMHETEPLTVACIRGNAVPDFGGGAAGSPSGNTFRTWLPEVPHIKVDIGMNDLHLYAQSNAWSHGPRIQNLGEGTVTRYVDPHTVI
jgi:hypothetical protein